MLWGLALSHWVGKACEVVVVTGSHMVGEGPLITVAPVNLLFSWEIFSSLPGLLDSMCPPEPKVCCSWRHPAVEAGMCSVALQGGGAFT